MPTEHNSPYWAADKAISKLRKIRELQLEKTYRPTVIVSIIDHQLRTAVVRHATGDTSWGLIQGEIEATDRHPLAAGLREGYEEACITDDMIEELYPDCGQKSFSRAKHQSVIIENLYDTGYGLGSEYFFVGMKLKDGADICVSPAKGHEVALLERRWLSSVDEAISILREQPGVATVKASTRAKVEQVLIPALKSVYQPESLAFSELLSRLSSSV